MEGWSRGAAPTPTELAALLSPEAAEPCRAWQQALAGQTDLVTRLLTLAGHQT
jgi:hypothetical protein